MKPKPWFLVADVVCLGVCLFVLSRSPAWAKLSFLDMLAMLGVGISIGVLITWLAARFGPAKPGPQG